MALLLLSALLCGGVARASSAPGSKKARSARPRSTGRFDAAAANGIAFRRVLKRGASGADVLRAQVLLDRAHFSVGEIDAVLGTSSALAVSAFKSARGLPGGDRVDEAAWRELNRDTGPALAPYTVAPEDVAGPFVKIPEDTMEKAKLPALGFRSAAEALAERFHASPALFRRLNPGRSLERAGERLIVPNVVRAPLGAAGSVVVSEADRSVAVLDAQGKMLARYPATVGSEHDPLPLGDWKILGVAKNPKYHYNPDLFWDADSADTKATLPPGPNSPVGVVWINLSKPHYGIHGSAEPSEIGKTQSHGCIRLTNWDAAELASVVAPGTPALLRP